MKVNDDYVRERRRGWQKERREKYWGARKAVEQADVGDENWQTFHWHYFHVLQSWLVMHTTVPISKAAEEGKSPYVNLWNEREFGKYEGLREVKDAFLGGRNPENLPAVELLHDVGEILEAIWVNQLDLPEQPPVVDPWHPDKVDPVDTAELAEELDVPKDVLEP